VDAVKLSVRGLDYKLLLSNIHLVGGASQIPNLQERLAADLKSEFDCDISITLTQEPIEGAWKGMHNFANKYPQLVG